MAKQFLGREVTIWKVDSDKAVFVDQYIFYHKLSDCDKDLPLSVIKKSVVDLTSYDTVAFAYTKPNECLLYSDDVVNSVEVDEITYKIVGNQSFTLQKIHLKDGQELKIHNYHKDDSSVLDICTKDGIEKVMSIEYFSDTEIDALKPFKESPWSKPK